jgi:hypothetical protein
LRRPRRHGSSTRKALSGRAGEITRRSSRARPVLRGLPPQYLAKNPGALRHRRHRRSCPTGLAAG